MIRTISFVIAGTLVVAFAASGCSKKDASKNTTADLPASNLPDSYWLKTAPTGAKPVVEVREKAKTGDQVVVTGIVGGRKQPFTDGAAAFTIVDDSVKKCTMDECETPWDFCCEPPENLKRSMVIVEFRDGASPLKTSARGFHGLDNMKNVVVTGEAKRDDAGNVIVVAKGVFITP
jgi:hypothetical protein